MSPVGDRHWMYDERFSSYAGDIRVAELRAVCNIISEFAINRGIVRGDVSIGVPKDGPAFRQPAWWNLYLRIAFHGAPLDLDVVFIADAQNLDPVSGRFVSPHPGYLSKTSAHFAMYRATETSEVSALVFDASVKVFEKYRVNPPWVTYPITAPVTAWVAMDEFLSYHDVAFWLGAERTVGLEAGSSRRIYELAIDLVEDESIEAVKRHYGVADIEDYVKVTVTGFRRLTIYQGTQRGFQRSLDADPDLRVLYSSRSGHVFWIAKK